MIEIINEYAKAISELSEKYPGPMFTVGVQNTLDRYNFLTAIEYQGKQYGSATFIMKKDLGTEVFKDIKNGIKGYTVKAIEKLIKEKDLMNTETKPVNPVVMPDAPKAPVAPVEAPMPSEPKEEQKVVA